jgi:hypothetical protein
LPASGPVLLHAFGDLSPLLGTHAFAATPASGNFLNGVTLGLQPLERRNQPVEAPPFIVQAPNRLVQIHGFSYFRMPLPVYRI